MAWYLVKHKDNFTFTFALWGLQAANHSTSCLTDMQQVLAETMSK